ncbi:head GIN domain-containing protein [Undibacterium sp. Ji22W]|uniref:head GIN domain-containing protein n=1 Tax=Undibacterium sp. Ji22W TaxID=3413038 RepID=UPI003BEFCBF1
MSTSHLRRHFLSLALLTTAFTAMPASADWSSWWGKGVEGSGKIIKQDRPAKDFRAIQISVPGKVELKQGTQEGVQIETDDNIQALLEVVVEGNTLKIRSKEKNVYPKTRNLVVVVNFKNLDDFALESSGSVKSDRIVSTDLKLRIGGSGEMEVTDLKAETLKVAIGGSGNFTARGSVPQISGSIGGSGELDLSRLAAKDVRISIGGSGSVQTWVSDNLNVSIGGSGNVSYYGDPRVNKSIGGSGSVTRKGAQP